MLIVFLTFVICVCVYVYGKFRFKYWKLRGVPTLAQQNVFFGDLARPLLGQENFLVTMLRAYKDFKGRGCKVGGIYSLNNPMLLVIDPEVSKYILVKDAEYFLDRGIEYDSKVSPISAHLFNLDGDEWRFIRRKLTPAFTSGKLRSMFWIIEEHLDVLCNVIEKKSGEDLHFSELFERLGMDTIGHAAFGVNCNALEDKVSDFRKVTSKIFKPSFSSMLSVVFNYAFKNHANIVLLLTHDKHLGEFFINLVQDTARYRKENNVQVNDFLQLLVDMMGPNGDGDDGLALETVAAQAFLFFIAAYETTSKSLTMAMFELGKDFEMQEELRREIHAALDLNGGKFGYEMVMGCKFLDLIVQETLRRYPPIPYLNRVCVKDYDIPGTDIVIEKGTPIIFPIYSSQMDPEHFPNPEKFDPHRFTAENKTNMRPYSNLPFGEGPRNCIGKRFGMYQLKMTIMKIIIQFEVEVSPNTKQPLTYDPITQNLLLCFKEKLLFRIKKLV